MVEPLDSGNQSLPLGICPDEDFHPFQVSLEPGDQVFLMTDGIFESMDQDNNLYGTERLRQIIAAPHSGLQECIAQIVADVEKFRADRPPFDDSCLVGFARDPE